MGDALKVGDYIWVRWRRQVELPAQIVRCIGATYIPFARYEVAYISLIGWLWQYARGGPPATVSTGHIRRMAPLEALAWGIGEQNGHDDTGHLVPER